MVDDSVFRTAFSNISQASTRAAFEQRFNAIQNGIINRLNDQIDKITDDGTERRLAELQSSRDDLFDYVGKANNYLFAVQTNRARLQEIALGSLSTAAKGEVDGDADTFTASEAANLNEAKEHLIENMGRMRAVYFPGPISDQTFVNIVYHDAQALDSLTAVAGTVDAEDSASTTNDNRALLDLLSQVSDRAVTLSESTKILEATVNDMIIKGQKEILSIEATLTEITAVEIAKKTEEIEALKIKYGNLLRAISTTFEVNSSIGDMLVTGTRPPPDRTSILNLFV